MYQYLRMKILRVLSFCRLKKRFKQSTMKLSSTSCAGSLFAGKQSVNSLTNVSRCSEFRFCAVLYLCLFGIGMYFAVRIEKYKKKYDIQTFKEIVAFTDGKSLDEIEKAREEGKRPYQKALLAAGSAALVVIIALIMSAVMRLFS